MNASKAHAKFERTLGLWRERLAGISDEDFTKTPPGGGWTLGQICDHVTVTHELMLDCVRRCAHGEGEEKGFQLGPAILTSFGSFPPGRFKVPPLPPEWQKIATPETISKDRAVEAFERAEGQEAGVVDALAGAPKGVRIKHPVGGWMNAHQWYRVAEMHMRHHLRQVRRIEKALATA